MSQTHMQIVHSEAMQRDRLERAARIRLARARARPSPGLGRRIEAVAIAFRRPELVRTRREPAAGGC